MELTTTQEQFVLKRLSDVWPKPRVCSTCTKHGPWRTSTISELREFNGLFSIGGASIIPVLTVICETCGTVRLFSAIHLGLISKSTGLFSKEM